MQSPWCHQCGKALLSCLSVKFHAHDTPRPTSVALSYHTKIAHNQTTFYYDLPPPDTGIEGGGNVTVLITIYPFLTPQVLQGSQMQESQAMVQM